MKKILLISVATSALLANTIEVTPKWNLFGTGEKAIDIQKSFKDNAIKNIWSFENYRWYSADERSSIKPFSGFWIKSDTKKEIELLFSETTSTTTLVNGWNLLGVGENSKSIYSIYQENEYIDTIWSYNSLSGWHEYTKFDIEILKPFSGYWAKMSGLASKTPLSRVALINIEDTTEGEVFYDRASDVFYEVDSILSLLAQSGYYLKVDTTTFEAPIKLDTPKGLFSVDEIEKMSKESSLNTTSWEISVKKGEIDEIEFSGAFVLENREVKESIEGVLKISEYPTKINPYGLFNLSAKITKKMQNPKPNLIELNATKESGNISINYSSNNAFAKLLFNPSTNETSGEVKYKLNNQAHHYEISFDGKENFTRKAITSTSQNKKRKLKKRKLRGVKDKNAVTIKLSELEKVDLSYTLLDENEDILKLNTGFSIAFDKDGKNYKGWADRWGIYHWSESEELNEALWADVQKQDEAIWSEFDSKANEFLNKYNGLDNSLWSEYDSKRETLLNGVNLDKYENFFNETLQNLEEDYGWWLDNLVFNFSYEVVDNKLYIYDLAVDETKLLSNMELTYDEWGIILIIDDSSLANFIMEDDSLWYSYDDKSYTLWSEYDEEYANLDQEYLSKSDTLWDEFWNNYQYEDEYKEVDLSGVDIYRVDENGEKLQKYSLYNTNGVLTKWSKRVFDLKDLIGVPLYYDEYVDGYYEASYMVVFNGSDFVKTKREVVNEYGEYIWQDVVSESRVKLTDLDYPINFWLDGLMDTLTLEGCVEKNYKYNCSIKEDSKLYFYSPETILEPKSNLACAGSECFNPNENEGLFFAKNTPEFKYTFSDGVLNYNQSPLSLETLDSKSEDGWWSMTLFEKSEPNMQKLLCDENYDGIKEEICSWNMWELDERYEYFVSEYGNELYKYTKDTIKLSDLIAVEVEYGEYDVDWNYYSYMIYFDGEKFIKSKYYDSYSGEYLPYTWDDNIVNLSNINYPMTIWIDGYNNSLNLNGCVENENYLYDCNIDENTNFTYYIEEVVSENIRELTCMGDYNCLNPKANEATYFVDKGVDIYEYNFNNMALSYNNKSLSASALDNKVIQGEYIPLFTLFENTPENLEKLYCDLDGDGLKEEICSWQIWELDEYYGWDIDNYYQLQLLRDENQNFVKFDDPINFLYNQPWEDGTTSNYLLTYWGEGELYGVPEVCMNDKGVEVNCYEVDTKSYPLFNVDSANLNPLTGEVIERNKRRVKVGKLKAIQSARVKYSFKKKNPFMK